MGVEENDDKPVNLRPPAVTSPADLGKVRLAIKIISLNLISYNALT
jgi:hypothetical protein